VNARIGTAGDQGFGPSQKFSSASQEHQINESEPPFSSLSRLSSMHFLNVIQIRFFPFLLAFRRIETEISLGHLDYSRIRDEDSMGIFVPGTPTWKLEIDLKQAQ
jgi:hypothetical protein